MPLDSEFSDEIIYSPRCGTPESWIQSIENGESIESRDQRSGNTFFLSCVQRGRTDLAFNLLDRGANIFAKNYEGFQALHLAHYWEDADVKQLIERGADINAKADDGGAPLMRFQKIKSMRILLEAGADVNARMNNGKTKLLALSMFSGTEDGIKLLAEFGADLDLKCESFRGESALYRCARGENIKLATLLLALGATPMKPTACRNDAWRRVMSLPRLHAAAYGGHTDVALKLIDEGYDPQAKHLRKTPRQWAALHQENETIAAMDSREALMSIGKMMAACKTKKSI